VFPGAPTGTLGPGLQGAMEPSTEKGQTIDGKGMVDDRKVSFLEGEPFNFPGGRNSPIRQPAMRPGGKKLTRSGLDRSGPEAEGR